MALYLPRKIFCGFLQKIFKDIDVAQICVRHRENIIIFSIELEEQTIEDPGHDTRDYGYIVTKF